MKPKLIITVKNGTVQNVTSNVDLEYVILDYDNLEVGEDMDLTIFSPDLIKEIDLNNLEIEQL